MTEWVEEIEVNGIRYTRARISSVGSEFVKLPIFGTGHFEIFFASLSVNGVYPQAFPVKIVYAWTQQADTLYATLKSGYIGGLNVLTIENEQLIGPGQLMGWTDNLTPNLWFDVIYRRVEY